jgi:AcrR family transcriptional regulator
MVPSSHLGARTMTPEERERDALLERIAAHVETTGLAGLSLDRLAKALRVPLPTLTSFFETKKELVVALIARNRIRLRERYAQLARDPALSDREFGRAMWAFYVESAGDSRLFFEAYGLALHDELYGEFMVGIDDWLQLMSDNLVLRGSSPEWASARASLSLAVFRGAMLDYCATGDRIRLDSAMELWFDLADGLNRNQP